MKDAVDALSQKKNISMLHFSEICPLPLTSKLDYIRIMSEAKVSICLEQNATGQFARLIRTETGFVFTHRLNRFDGRPYMLEELTGEIDAITG
jgi:2-oxoglutarate ferredoxin oxidoreductase subunit alpha